VSPLADGLCGASHLLHNQKPLGSLNDPFYLRILMARHEEEQQRIRANALINSGIHLEAVQAVFLAALAEDSERLPPP
jgi:hypothetical protein